MRRVSLAVSAALLLTSCAAQAASDEETEPALELTGRVVDAADILSSDFEVRLTDKLEMLESETQVQLVVATTPDLEGQEIASYSLDLANSWGLGHVDRNDGLMVLVAPNERKVRIEVGLGLEPSITDEEAAEIIREDLLPYFSNNKYEAGLDRGVNSLIIEIAPIEMKEAG